MMSSILLFIGTTELMLIACIALLLFGGKKLPEIMRGIGLGIKELKKGVNEVAEPYEDVKETFRETAGSDDNTIESN